MHSSQFTFLEFKAFLRRRKVFLIIPPILVTAICVVGAMMLPKKYESSTTIWVQPDEILNPLVSYQMAVQLASADRLQTFMEIIYSRKTIETVIRAVGIGAGISDGVAWDDLIESVRRNIRTARKGSDSFTLSYQDTDPVRAQKVVSTLAQTFIDTRIMGEERRNGLTVEFFERKLKEYEEKFDTTQHDMVSLLMKRMRERPTGGGGLSAQLEDLEQRIQRTREKIALDEQAVEKLAMFPDAFHSDQGKQALASLRRADLPYADELRSALQQYEDITSRYTPLHPDVGRAENDILEVLRKMRIGVEGDRTSLSAQLGQLQENRQRLVDELMKYNVDQQEDLGTKSNYQLYQRLYEDMKTKLEQARITQELGKDGENSFIIIDPARVPAKPSKPNQPLIVVAGFIGGLILGVAAALAAESFDSRIRSVGDVEAYHLPVLALLPEVRAQR